MLIDTQQDCGRRGERTVSVYRTSPHATPATLGWDHVTLSVIDVEAEGGLVVHHQFYAVGGDAISEPLISPGCGIGMHRITVTSPRPMEIEKWLENTAMGYEHNSSACGKADQMPSPTMRYAADANKYTTTKMGL